MEVVALFILLSVLKCSGMNTRPSHVKQFFDATVKGKIGKYEIVGEYQDGEFSRVLKASEVVTEGTGMDIVIKVAKLNPEFDSKALLENEWNAYKHLEAKLVEAEKLMKEIPLVALPILAETHFLVELPILVAGGQQLVLGMECFGEDLFTVVEEASDATLQLRLQYAPQMLIILAFLQFAGLVHRDIKLENFVLAAAAANEKTVPRLRLIDPAFAYFGENSLKLKVCGTIDYASERDHRGWYDTVKQPTPCPKSDAQSGVYALMILLSGTQLYWAGENEVTMLHYKGEGFEYALNEMMKGSEYAALKVILNDMNKEAGERPSEIFGYNSYIERFSALIEV